MRSRGSHALRRPNRVRLAAVGCALGLVSAGVAALPPGAAAVDSCTVPSLNDVLVSQGPAQATALVAGKTSLVKLFLGTASCLPLGASVQITAGRLFVGGSGTGLPLAASLPLPPLAPSTTTPVNSSPSDALFVVPGSAMRATTGNTVTFSAVLSYKVTLNGQTTPGSVTFSYAPGATPSLSAPVVPTLNHVDVLVVPLGTANGGSLSTQYTNSTRQATELGFGTARRLLPTTDDGLSYSTSAGVVIPGTTSPLCASGTTWSLSMAPLIEAQRVAWNSISTNTHMDRALGVIDPAFSSGPSTTLNGASSCADGFGELSGPSTGTAGVVLSNAGPGTDSFARAVTTTSTFGGPDVGSLFTMETAHTTGAVSATYPPNATSGPNGGTRAVGAHSAWITGDPQTTNRVYDLDTQLPITSSRSAMKFTNVGWWDKTTILEKQDWDYLICSLLPVPPGASVNNPTLAGLAPELTSCNTPGSFGYAAAADNESYAIFGTTDGTPAGTQAETTDSGSHVTDAPVPASSLRAVQFDVDGNVLANDGIGVHLNSSEHDGDNDPVFRSTTATFGALVPAQSGTHALALYLGQPSTSNPPLYVREVTSRPSFRTVNIGPADVTVTVNHMRPDNLRMDMFGSCAAGTAPLLLDVHPTVSTPSTGGIPGAATFSSTYDPSLLCANPLFSIRVTDGIQSAMSEGTSGSGGASAATAEITAPAPGATATTFASIGLAGRVADTAGKDAASVRWTATSGAVTTTVATSATGTAVPPSGGWPTGLTTLTLSGFDAQGNLLASDSRTVNIALDSDGDGLSDDLENAQSCFGPGAAHDPFTANLDSDGDGYANIDDPQPCVSASNVTMGFDPQSLYKSANGQNVTVYLSNPKTVNLATLRATDLAVQQIGGATVGRLTGSATALLASSLQLTSPTTATVKFNRSALVALLGSRLGYTPIFIGTTDGRMRGADPASPVVFP